MNHDQVPMEHGFATPRIFLAAKFSSVFSGLSDSEYDSYGYVPERPSVSDLIILATVRF